MAMTLVETVTVGSGGVASITFTNIPQTGKDLLLICSLRLNNNGSGTTDYSLHLNNETTGTNYTYRTLMGFGTSIGNYTGTGARLTFEINDLNSTANTFSNSSIYFSNYTSSAEKVVSIDSVTENNGTSGVKEISANRWNNTAAINSITLTRSGSNTAQHSTASLYIIS